jgi:hypothetical protein
MTNHCVPLLLVGIAAIGCGKPEPPARVPVSGIVTIDGKPVPSAVVTFYPSFEGFGGEVIAEGVTDVGGRYSLTCPLGPGADAPTPEDAREQSVAGQQRMQAFLKSLTNRPIGAKFGTLATSPLEVEVSAGGGSYDLQLTH